MLTQIYHVLLNRS